MQLAGDGKLELLQHLRGIAEASAGSPENLPKLLEPDSGESAFLPRMRTKTTIINKKERGISILQIRIPKLPKSVTLSCRQR
jgi:hypothetical protein